MIVVKQKYFCKIFVCCRVFLFVAGLTAAKNLNYNLNKNKKL